MKEAEDRSSTRGQALLEETIQAHGGLQRWAKVHAVTAQVQVRGLMPTWLFPGRPIDDYHYRQTVDAHHQRTVLDGFPQPGQQCTFTPAHVTIHENGRQTEQRTGAREAFRGIRPGAIRRAFHWDALDSAYFLGYAMSNYLTHPYSLTNSEIDIRRGPDNNSNGEIWRQLMVRHPPGFDSHCQNETFFIDQRGMIRRHEYTPDIFTIGRIASHAVHGTIRAAHITTRHRQVDGLTFPTFRRIVLAPTGRRPIPGLTIICAQLSEITISDTPTPKPTNTTSHPTASRNDTSPSHSPHPA